ncbi:MAG: WG repeat-containing protein [Sphingobacteriaceae bacterium]|nr:WG repeat-containing protein [Sphingobacteriaceae bacterium]MBK7311529.1 WG repeat-containing protein [Sphingobacteriaceae bacterium]
MLSISSTVSKLMFVITIFSGCVSKKNYTHTDGIKKKSEITIIPTEKVVHTTREMTSRNIIPLYQFDVSDNSIYAFQSFYNSKTGEYGIADSSGNIIIPSKYDWVRTNFNNSFRVALKGKVGLIDPNDNVLIPIGKYSMIDEPNEGLMPAKLGNGWGYLDMNGSPIVDFVFTHVTSFRQGRAFVQKEHNGKYAILDNRGQAISDFVFTCNNTCFFQNERCLVQYSDSQDIIDLNGKPQFGFKYEQLMFLEPERSFFWVKKKGGKWGKVNPENEILLPFDYDGVKYKDGRFITYKKGKWEE